ncbi:MAG: sensor histidine kinase [Caldilineaceae bacterium]
MKSWLKPFIALEQPIATVNHWLTIIYAVVLLVFVAQIGLSGKVVVLASALAFVHFGKQRAASLHDHLLPTVYLLQVLEFVLLFGLSVGTTVDQSSTIFQLYTVDVMLNYPAYFALPLIASGYWLYLWLIALHPFTIDGYLLSLINFSIVPLSVMGVRLLIEQRQRILKLNQRLQSQAELMAEMSKLRERNNLAEAMHDTLGHTLTSAIVSLEGATLLLAKRPAEAVALLDTTREQLQASLGDIRQTVRTLKTDILADHITLQESLRQLAERVSRQTAVAIDLQYQLAVELLPIQDYVLYTIVREGMTNALKHGQATHIQITLAEMADNCIALTMTDNGVGASSVAPGFGLTHLEQKVQALGGVLTIETQKQSGFRLHIVLPLALVATAPQNTRKGRNL